MKVHANAALGPAGRLALLHVDIARLARFNCPGHAATGVRDKTWSGSSPL